MFVIELIPSRRRKESDAILWMLREVQKLVTSQQLTEKEGELLRELVFYKDPRVFAVFRGRWDKSCKTLIK